MHVPSARERLVRLLGGDDLVWLRQRVRQALEAGRPVASVTLRSPTPAQRAAVAGLLGRRLPRGEALTVRLSDVEAVLRHSGTAPDLPTAIALLDGPLVDRRAERESAQAERDAPFDAAHSWLTAHPVRLSWVEEWLASVRRSGVLARLQDAALRSQALVQALTVAASLTAASDAPAVGRNELAARSCGDAHALDDGSVRGALVMRALALAAGVPLPAAAAERRALWERFGVVADTVSSTCLVLGLRPRSSSPVATRLCHAADAGDPVHLTGWDLARSELDLSPDSEVLVCENPRVIEALAQRRGGEVPALCTSGMPNLVVLSVLGRLRAAGTTLRYHGDFDWPGIAIANRLVATAECQPWLMSAADYLAAARPGGLPLEGTPVTPSWDAGLGEAMQRVGVAVHEEAVLDALMSSL